MADGPVCIGDLAKTAALEHAVNLASKEGYLECCKPVPIPSMPGHLMRVQPEWLAEMRAKNHDDEDGTVSAYNAWETAKAGAISENENRLRGVLWCLRELRRAYAENQDPALKTLGKHVRRFIATYWGIDDPPATYSDAYMLAMRTVAAMVTREGT